MLCITINSWFMLNRYFIVHCFFVIVFCISYTLFYQDAGACTYIISHYYVKCMYISVEVCWDEVFIVLVK